MQKTDSIEITFPVVSRLTGMGWPVVVTSVFDRTSYYQLALSLCIVTMVIAAALMLRLRFSPTFKE